jgi:hypothetical protein
METLPKTVSYVSTAMSPSKSAADSLKDRLIRVDVVDANDAPIPGATVNFFVNGTFAGEQVTANGRATIQISGKKTRKLKFNRFMKTKSPIASALLTITGSSLSLMCIWTPRPSPILQHPPDF